MMKRILIVLLTAALCLPLGITAGAAGASGSGVLSKRITGSLAQTRKLSAVPAQSPEDDAEAQANALKSLGLFKGVSDTDFDLDRTPTRVEAVVMLIRLLGREEEALAAGYSHSFADVPAWADAYIAYARSEGLTNGISETEFGTGDASAAMYLTFVLRALGYADWGTDRDFTWDDPFALAEAVGILDGTVSRDDFLRADVVRVSYKALSAKMKDSESTLAEMLMRAGVFTAKELLAAGIASKNDGEPIVYILPVEPKPEEVTE